MTTGTFPPDTIAVVDAFLATVAAGQGGELGRLYTDDALLDAVVPDWRFQVRGAAAIAKQYSG